MPIRLQEVISSLKLTLVTYKYLPVSMVGRQVTNRDSFGLHVGCKDAASVETTLGREPFVWVTIEPVYILNSAHEIHRGYQ